MVELYPLRLEPHLSPRLWGGNKLQTFLKSIPESAFKGPEAIGEAWLVYEDNLVSEGPLAGHKLAKLAKDYGTALLGSLSVKRYGHKVPLLAKLIDARDKLSIQVHPDDPYALTHESASGHLGKTEAWYILESQHDGDLGEIIWGFKETMTPQSLREAIMAGEIESSFNHLQVSPGDLIYNPAGTLHAIGSGIFLFEIQQSSDLTYRLYDYDRLDAQGNLRELHFDKALAVLDYRANDQAKIRPQRLSEDRELLISCEAFALESLRLAGCLSASTSAKSLEILTLITGHAKLSYQGQSYELWQGDALLLAASLGTYQLEGHGQVLKAYIPDEDNGALT
ncbi:MAG: type I phosphomannose isomerase catalytic subunit [Deinococcales bacterium]